MPPKRSQRKKRAPRKMKKHPISRGLGGVPDVASLTETITNRRPQGAFYQSNISYRLYDTSLSQCPRAALVGQAYQEYRIRRVTLCYKPMSDTFAAGGSGAVPNLYYMVDKKGVISNNFTLDNLTQMGATPRRFDDKTIVAKYAPAVLLDSLDAAFGAQAASAMISPWLPTTASVGPTGLSTPSSIDHLGISWLVYVPNFNTPVYYDIDIKVDFEFRKPLWATITPGPRALNWNEEFTQAVDPVVV